MYVYPLVLWKLNGIVIVAFFFSFRFPPPEIPDDFDGRHKFPTPVQSAEKFSDLAPLVVPPPEDISLTLLIEGCAAMVARCGKHIEDFYKEKSKTNPQFLFLTGGDGSNYYMRKLWEHQQKYIGQQRPDSAKSKPSSDNLTAENRGKILGERPLDRSTKVHSSSLSAKEAVQLQSNLIDTFVKPISLVSYLYCIGLSLLLPLLVSYCYVNDSFLFCKWIYLLGNRMAYQSLRSLLEMILQNKLGLSSFLKINTREVFELQMLHL